jgi:hypothetical protein
MAVQMLSRLASSAMPHADVHGNVTAAISLSGLVKDFGARRVQKLVRVRLGYGRCSRGVVVREALPCCGRLRT